MDEYIRKEDVLDIASQYCTDDDGSCSKADVDSREMLDEIEALPAADLQPVDRWINCKDKMPDTPEQGMDAKCSDCCLVCDDFGWIGMGYYLTDGKKSWWEFADAQNKIKIDWTEITHWMPLPEPPKDGESK